MTAFSFDFLLEICFLSNCYSVYSKQSIISTAPKEKKKKKNRNWMFRTTKDLYKLAGVKICQLGETICFQSASVFTNLNHLSFFCLLLFQNVDFFIDNNRFLLQIGISLLAESFFY